MYRTRLLNDLVAIDARIVDATGRAAHAPSNHAFDTIIVELREYRAQRAEMMAKLDQERDRTPGT